MSVISAMICLLLGDDPGYSLIHACKIRIQNSKFSFNHLMLSFRLYYKAAIYVSRKFLLEQLKYYFQHIILLQSHFIFQLVDTRNYPLHEYCLLPPYVAVKQDTAVGSSLVILVLKFVSVTISRNQGRKHGHR